MARVTGPSVGLAAWDTAFATQDPRAWADKEVAREPYTSRAGPRACTRPRPTYISAVHECALRCRRLGDRLTPETTEDAPRAPSAFGDCLGH